MKKSHNPACNGCLYDAGTLCLSKTKKKMLKYERYNEGNDVIFQLIYCGERKVMPAATSS